MTCWVLGFLAPFHILPFHPFSLLMPCQWNVMLVAQSWGVCASSRGRISMLQSKLRGLFIMSTVFWCLYAFGCQNWQPLQERTTSKSWLWSLETLLGHRPVGLQPSTPLLRPSTKPGHGALANVLIRRRLTGI